MRGAPSIDALSAWRSSHSSLFTLDSSLAPANNSSLVTRHLSYSNVFSRVTTPERTMEGTYFLSDEHLRHYTVSNSKGAFSREDMTGEKTDEEETKDPKDTIKVEPYVRPQTQKHRRIAP